MQMSNERKRARGGEQHSSVRENSREIKSACSIFAPLSFSENDQKNVWENVIVTTITFKKPNTKLRYEQMLYIFGYNN